MSHSIRSACIFLACAMLAHAEPPDPKKQEIADLIQEISPPHIVDWREDLLAHPERNYPDEVAKARARLEQDKLKIPKLRQLLKVDTSVFDYPGLLSRGNVSFNGYGLSGDGSYTLWISARYVGREAAILPWEFKLDFSDRGTITKIYDVRWKN